MTYQNVFTFKENGQVQFTLSDAVFNPFPDTRRSVKRVGDIVFSDIRQMFRIHLIAMSSSPPVCIKLLDSLLGVDALEQLVQNSGCLIRAGVLYFKTYEEAVAAEVKVVNALRLAGIDVEGN